MQGSSKLIRMRPMGLLVLMALVSLLSACQLQGGNPLQDTAWELVSLNGSDVLPDRAISLEFSDKKASGSAGCNQYEGTYQVRGDRLTLGQTFSTLMACFPDEVMEQEQRYLEALQATDTYQIHDTQLELYDSRGTLILVFEAQPGYAPTP